MCCTTAPARPQSGGVASLAVISRAWMEPSSSEGRAPELLTTLHSPLTDREAGSALVPVLGVFINQGCLQRWSERPSS